MERFDYLIVGGGMAADAAVKGIREIDDKGTVGVLGDEADPPYKRPPLSKKLWMGKPEDTIWLHTQDAGADVRLGTRVTRLDPGGGRVLDENANEYAYGKLLIATGGSPRRLSPDTEGVIYYRTVPDYHRLRELTERGERFAVIGGGFIGSEVAAALAMNNKRVTMIFPSTGVGEKVYPREISSFLVDYFRERGVEVLAGDAPARIHRKGDSYIVETRMGRELTVDGVVAGIGISPNTELAESAEIQVDNGVVVDGFLRASRPGVFAAGDVACYYDMVLNRRRRVEHEDNAVTMGTHAGRAMAGDMTPYTHTPYFYSDLFDLGYEAVGDTDVALQTFADWREPFKEGVVYYMQGDRVRGVLLWNVWDKVPAATELIADPGPFTPDDLKGRIAN